MPSDDEDEDEDEDEAIYSSEDSGQQSLRKASKKLTKQKLVAAKPKSTIPLPSDEEDNTGKHLSFP